jgi:hypothetical protein
VRSTDHVDGHAPYIPLGGTSRQTWIDLCQKTGADPRELTERHIDRLITLVLEASTIDAIVSMARVNYSVFERLC